jgi:hypothetical protein
MSKGFPCCDILPLSKVKDKANRKQTAIKSIQLTWTITIVLLLSKQRLVCLPQVLMPPFLKHKMRFEEVDFLHNACFIVIN